MVLRLVVSSRTNHLGDFIKGGEAGVLVIAFRSKLWLDDRPTRVYRGVYQWDGAEDAVAYAGRMVGLLARILQSGHGALDTSCPG